MVFIEIAFAIDWIESMKKDYDSSKLVYSKQKDSKSSGNKEIWVLTS